MLHWWRVNDSAVREAFPHTPTHQCRARSWTSRKYPYSSLRLTRLGIEPIPTALVARAQPTAPLNRYGKQYLTQFANYSDISKNKSRISSSSSITLCVSLTNGQ